MADKHTGEFEENLRRLEECAEKLRSGELTLEESLEVYNNSITYYTFCTEYLKNARQKIEICRPESGAVEELETPV